MTQAPSAEQLQALLDDALPEGQLNPAGATRLLAFLDALPPLLLPRIDEQWRVPFRGNTPGPAGWFRAVQDWRWHSTFPSWLTHHPDELLTAPGVVAALAGSPDGYARESAVRLLARLDAPLTTGILLVRAGDWAPPVRAAALEALHARLSDAYADHWARYAALVDRLERLERGDAVLAELAWALLRTPAGLQAIRRNWPGADRDTRLTLLRVLEQLSGPPRLLWLGTLTEDPHVQVRRRVVELLPAEGLHARLADPNAGVRERVLSRLLGLTPLHEVPAFLLTALLDPRSSVRALAQFEARRRGVHLRAAYLKVEVPFLSAAALRGWAAGVREQRLIETSSHLEALLGHANARVRLEALLALGTLAPTHHVDRLEDALLGSAAQARVGELTLRAAHLLTQERLEALWHRTTTDRQRRRLLRLAAGLPRFDAAAVLLTWRAETRSALSEELDDTLHHLLTGFGTRYYTRPSLIQQAALGRAVQTGTLNGQLRSAVEALLP
ncbi:hypothetical protein [Deinococcus sp. QL22]|uniref:hypothetical protein n=1 Tax=Deinococcus sp. QL22 TaxID=2939437 RepID=UPI00201779C0|nr:hypothetical protein [Deinococcus sp. QL22]UQN06534.1 hypothetical protein M1R55_01030 [Deinococcus sp. QL22]